MSSFTDPLIVTPLSDGRSWRLIAEFDYHVGAEDSPDIIHVPEGFVMDFASIPRSLEPLLAPWAKYNKAPIIHDYLYRTQWRSRRQSDAIFLEAMRVDLRNHRSGKFVARVEWLAVRLFGWLAWQRRRSK